jgi:hypothetical protein
MHFIDFLSKEPANRILNKSTSMEIYFKENPISKMTQASSERIQIKAFANNIILMDAI